MLVLDRDRFALDPRLNELDRERRVAVPDGHGFVRYGEHADPQLLAQLALDRVQHRLAIKDFTTGELHLLNEYSNVKLSTDQRAALLRQSLPRETVWMQTIGLGSICTRETYAYGDTARFELRTFDTSRFGEEVFLTVGPVGREGRSYRDTIPFGGVYTRVSVPTTELGLGMFRAVMLVEVVEPEAEFGPGQQPFASGSCFVRIE